MRKNQVYELVETLLGIVIVAISIVAIVLMSFQGCAVKVIDKNFRCDCNCSSGSEFSCSVGSKITDKETRIP